MFFLQLHLGHREVPGLGVKSELQLLAYTTAMWDPNLICSLRHSSWQCQMPNPLSEAMDQTRILTGTSRICFHCTRMGTPWKRLIFKYKKTPLMSMDRSSRQKINKVTEILNDTKEKLDLIDIFRTYIQKNQKIHSSQVHRKLNSIPPMNP